MSSLLLSVPELVNSYKSWVSKNPQAAGDWETTAKWVSYFLAGRINNSHVVSELIYCLSNLLVLLNDNIIRKNVNSTLKSSVDKIKLWLSVVEYSEVFCELSVQKIWGNTGKWIVVVAIQVFKCVARLLLVYKHKETTIENPIIPPLQRTQLSKDQNANSTGLASDISQSFVTFTLKRSGRVVRKVESSPPLGLRSWKPVEVSKTSLPTSETQTEGVLLKRQLIAETLYISKPLLHLISMGMFGTRSWKPWMVSMAMDLTSLQLYKSTHRKSLKGLSEKQKLQLSKRTILLLLYLIRSPFYEKYSKNKIGAFLNALSQNIPLAKLICQPLLQYVPFWQSTYFYMWST
ncbi:peroxisomal membrane protein PEX16 [Anthonomus grandis grandis]|uniref:peroxisomal membrane protein PEX16 n=1 Tax=Anthonomus grandis grandis TaxID=2921223 RepID=UPI0021651A6B|nr:peroxisomal membrane protein PEX16 [Anthonomus grandis grandis]